MRFPGFDADHLFNMERKVHERTRGFMHEFRGFVFKQNIISLALGVIIGAATGQVVNAFVQDVFMPVIEMLSPGQSWREWSIPIGHRMVPDPANPGHTMPANAIRYGDVIWQLLYLIIVGLVCFTLTKLLLKPPPPAPPPPPTRECPHCLERVPQAATRCRACASDLPAPTPPS